MNAIFPVVNEQINKRNKKVRSCLSLETYVVLIASPPTSQLLDYDAARSKMNKLIAKTSDDPTKLPRVSTTTPHLVSLAPCAQIQGQRAVLLRRAPTPRL